MDTAGGGGSLEPLDRILPLLDAYVPSWVEARSQTGQDDAEQMIRTYRDCGCRGLLGIKMGKRGALLSPPDGALIHVQPVSPPDAVVNTTGAGDCFFAGLITGLVRGLSIADSGRIAATAGACSVTQVSSAGGVRDWDATRRLAGLS